jgi:hypothetical protein
MLYIFDECAQQHEVRSSGSFTPSGAGGTVDKMADKATQFLSEQHFKKMCSLFPLILFV